MFPLGISIFLLAVFAVSRFEGKKPETKQPNIVFILADDLGWNDVSYHGYSQISTPNIDRLAHEGVILDSHYSQAVCTPSRAALMTAKYPFRLGLQNHLLVVGEDRGVPLEEKLLPEFMKDLGYSTHMVGKWHLGYSKKAYTPTWRGFDSFFGFYLGTTNYYNYTSNFGPPTHLGFDLWDGLEAQEQYKGYYMTDLFAEKVENIIEDHDTETPLFLYYSNPAPHYGDLAEPVQAPQRYVDRFPHIPTLARRTYAGMLAAMDDSVGRVYDALENKGILDNTIIVFSSDNGGQGQQHGTFAPAIPQTYGSNWPLRGEKSSLWEGGVRVPAWVWSPLIKQRHRGRVTNELYHLVDWLPTLYNLGGGKVKDLPNGIDGEDIWKSIAENKKSPRKEIAITINSFPTAREYALRWNQYKVHLGSLLMNNITMDKWLTPVDFDASYVDSDAIVQCGDFNTTYVPCDANTSPCLFNIVTDPCEYNNIASEKPDILQLMLDKIAAYNATAAPPQAVGLPALLASSVYSGGYIQPWIF